MTVRAKFKCWSNKDGNVNLQTVTDGSEENKVFWEHTPSGSISLNTNNPAAVEQFVVGEECYVDFTFIKKGGE